jgi:YNFM family putative membrane transporter
VARTGSAKDDPATSSQQEARRYRRILFALIAAGVATFTELYAIQGVLTQLAEELQVSPSEASLAISFATTGVALGVLPWAWAGDRFGRLRCMQFAVSAAVVFGLLAAVMPSFEALLAVRLLGGVALAGVPVLAVAYIRETLKGSMAAAAAAAYIAGTTVGGAGGRVISGALSPELGWRGAVLGAGVASLAVAVVFLALAPRSAVRPRGGGSQWARLRSATSRLALWRLYVQGLLLTGSFVAVYNFLGFRVEAPPYSVPPSLAALLFLSYFAGTVTSRMTGSWLPRLGYTRTVLVGFFGMAVGLGVMLIENLVAVILGLVVFTASFFLAHAAAVATVGEVAGAQYQSQASAMYTIMFYLGSGVLGWLLGLFFEQSGWPALTLAIGIVLVVCAAFCTIGRPRRSGQRYSVRDGA